MICSVGLPTYFMGGDSKRYQVLCSIVDGYKYKFLYLLLWGIFTSYHEPVITADNGNC
jgi:hypothetical protein